MTMCLNQLFKKFLWAIFNSFIEFTTILLLLYALVLAMKHVELNQHSLYCLVTF